MTTANLTLIVREAHSYQISTDHISKSDEDTFISEENEDTTEDNDISDIFISRENSELNFLLNSNNSSPRSTMVG